MQSFYEWPAREDTAASVHGCTVSKQSEKPVSEPRQQPLPNRRRARSQRNRPRLKQAHDDFKREVTHPVDEADGVAAILRHEVLQAGEALEHRAGVRSGYPLGCKRGRVQPGVARSPRPTSERRSRKASTSLPVAAGRTCQIQEL